MAPVLIFTLLLGGMWLLSGASADLRAAELCRAPAPEAPGSVGAEGVESAGLLLELTAALFAAGLSLPDCLARLAPVTGAGMSADLTSVSTKLRLGLPWQQAWAADTDPRLVPYREAVAFSAESGAPSASLLRAQAAALRQERSRRLQQKAASLGVKLVLPMGLCALPAFIALAVVPVLLALLPHI